MLDRDATIASTKLVYLSKSAVIDDMSYLRKYLVIEETFTVDKAQARFDQKYSGQGQHLFTMAVVDCIGKIAENASYGDCMNSVCKNYKGFSQDYFELEVLARRGYKVPSRPTMLAWLTGNNSTIRLIRFNGLPCLLNNKGIMYPFLPGSDLIAKVVVASAQNSSKITGRCTKPIAFVEDVLRRFKASDAKLEVLTMLLRTFSFVESSVASIGNTTPNVSGDMLIPGHVSGRGVMMGRVSGVGAVR